MTERAWHDRDVRFGDGAIDLLPAIVERAGAERVLLVTGRSSFEASGAARVVGPLESVANVTRWADFEPNTDAADLHRGLTVAAEVAPDLIVAIGGGSAMDMAKLLGAYDAIDDPAVLHEAIRSGDRIGERQQGLVLVPTTSGSGSEATHFAVVYIGEDKYSVAGPALLPDTTLLDPPLTLSGSPYQRATSGIDAVAQAIESLWAVGATDESRGFAREALEILLDSIEGYVTAPTAQSARAMALGSHLAGRAIDISKTTAAHALAYGITKQHGISHGHAVALTLGVFIDLHRTATRDRLRRGTSWAVHERAMMDLSALLSLDVRTGAETITSLMTRIGLATDVQSVIGHAPDVDYLADRVNSERLLNDPLALVQEDVLEILRHSLLAA